MGTSGGAVLVSSIALVLAIANTAVTLLQRRTTRRAAITSDLYPVLRSLRDAAWQFAKPLGGQGADSLIAVHYALVDLSDLMPAIHDAELKALAQELLDSEAAATALGIDPPRFMMLMGDLSGPFDDFASTADRAVKRCQQLRRGVS